MKDSSQFSQHYPVQHDTMGAEHFVALDALLETDIGMTAEVLPPLWHWTYFLDRPRQSALGPDGHPRVGRPSPPAPGLRRMFAGGRVTTNAPLRLGVPATLHTSASDPVSKTGRSGTLWFVTLRYVYSQDGVEAIVEERDLVYREAALPAGRILSGAASAEWTKPVDGDGIDLPVDETLLFRFSALTYNAHRIHYDLGWAAHEGYGGLVVHGPLQAMMMGEWYRRTGVDLVGRTFAYRLVAPMIGTQLLRVRPTRDHETDAAGVAVHAADARVTATGQLSG